MALAPQLSAKYTIIGGAREVGPGRANYFPEPNLGSVNLASWSIGGGVSYLHTGLAAYSGWRGLRLIGAPATQPTLATRNNISFPYAGTFVVSAWVRGTFTTGTSLQIGFLNLVGSTVTPTVSAVTGGVWTRIKSTVVVVGGDLIGDFQLKTSSGNLNSGGSVDLDAISIVEGTAWDPGYFDGDTPGYYWTGFPERSTSAQDGTRAVLNDDTDPDMVGNVAEVTGLDAPEVRENSTDNVEADGAVHGEFYQGRRPITLTAWVGANATAAGRNAKLQRFLAATNQLRKRGPAYREGDLSWQPAGAPEPVHVVTRRQVPPRVTGAMLKDVNIGLVSDDPRIYGTAWNYYDHSYVVGAAPGATFDRSFDLNLAWGNGGGDFSITNTGDALAPMVLTFFGNVTNPGLQNLTTGEELAFTGAVSGTYSEKLTVDTKARTVIFMDSVGVYTNAYDRLQVARSKFFGLVPGVNNFRALYTTYSAPGVIRVAWRNAWA